MKYEFNMCIIHYKGDPGTLSSSSSKISKFERKQKPESTDVDMKIL